jgi:hypothetical protein
MLRWPLERARWPAAAAAAWVEPWHRFAAAFGFVSAMVERRSSNGLARKRVSHACQPEARRSGVVREIGERHFINCINLYWPDFL